MPFNTTCTAPIIGIHHSPLSQKFGTPRQPNLVNLTTHITLLPPYDTPDAFDGIDHFSHLWIIWQFHQNRPQSHFRPQVRPPRFGGNQKMGVFATRSMYRPSQFGLSVVQLSHLSTDGTGRGVSLHIIGADMINGTPIIDIKPYLPYSDSLPIAISPITTPTVKPVKISLAAQNLFDTYITKGKLSCTDITHISALVSQDPRPAYRQKETNTIFVMRYKTVDIEFLMTTDSILMITDIRACHLNSHLHQHKITIL